MGILTRAEYDASYFDGKLQPTRHNAGYSLYNEWVHGVIREGQTESELTTQFKERALSMLNRFQNPNQKVMVICCAKGYLVKHLIDLGFDAYGIDWSNYAITQGLAEMPELAGRIWEADVNTEVQLWGNNEYDLILSFHSLCCFSDDELNGTSSQDRGLIYHLNRKTNQQFHLVTPEAPTEFYNPKTLVDWVALGWEQGTVISDKNGNFEVK